MGQEFTKNCCNNDEFIEKESQETNLNFRKWKYINNEEELNSSQMSTIQPIHKEKNNICFHPYKPNEKKAQRVHKPNNPSKTADKIIEESEEFTLVKERENLPVLGPYFYFKEKSTYFGQYRKGSRHGIGECVWRDGSIYHGEWNQDKMSGYGRLITCDGDVYVGDFFNGLREGIGKLVLKDESTSYSGGWNLNLRHGTGLQTYPDGGKFVGTFKNGIRQGQGMYVNKKKKFKMKGNWVDGKRQGVFVTTVGDQKFEDKYNEGKLYEKNSKGFNGRSVEEYKTFIYDDKKVGGIYKTISKKIDDEDLIEK